MGQQCGSANDNGKTAGALLQIMFRGGGKWRASCREGRKIPMGLGRSATTTQIGVIPFATSPKRGLAPVNR